MEWWQNMNALLAQKGWTPAELARRSGLSYDNIAKYSNGRVAQPRGDAVSIIAYTLGVTEEELRFKSGIASQKSLARGEIVAETDQSAQNEGTRRIPLLSLWEIARHRADKKLTDIWSGDMSVIVDDSVGTDCVAVTIDDTSMMPRFSPGDVVICDPDAPIEPGNYVLARVNGYDKALFRRYRLFNKPDQGRVSIELKPLNDDYPTAFIDDENPGELIGRCIRVIQKI